MRMEIRHEQILSRCLSIDLEVNPGEAKVFAIAAVHHDDRPALKCAGRPTEQFLDALEAQIGDVAHPIGHNFLSHDLEHLVAARPRLGRIMTAPIDTLWLNPLAFPRNPYHHLVKHYHDGRLATGHVHDPELDARLADYNTARPHSSLGYQTPAGFALNLTNAIARPAARDESSARRAIAQPAPTGVNKNPAQVAVG